MNAPATRATPRPLALETGNLPSEFLLFKFGENPSTKGVDVFDRAAAEALMSKARERGQVDFPIDLEHRSLDPAAVALSADATDAQGWFRLGLKGDGLYAVDVKWTDAGAARLRGKLQRYISPAFYPDASGRPVELINAALVSMPAYHDRAPLVAASRTGRKPLPVNAATRARAAAVLERLGRKSSTVLAVRLPNDAADELRKRAVAVGVTPGALLRALATEAKATAKDRARLLELLRLGADASDEQIQAAVAQLLTDTGEAAGAPPPAAGAGATAGNADAPAAASLARARIQRSASQAQSAPSYRQERLRSQMTHAHAARAHDLTDDRTTPEQALAWFDEGVADYDARVTLLGDWIGKLKGRRGHAADYARNHWKAELARLESVRKQKEAAVPAREKARDEYRKALDTVRAHAAKPLPDDTEGELKRIAEGNGLSRRLTAAHRAFVSACQATKLPSLPSMHHEFIADEETRALAAKWQRLRHYEPGRVNDAIELAYTQGRSSDVSVLPFYAVAEAELDIPETRALYAVRWEAIGRKHRLPYDEVDLEAAALAADEAAAAAE